jgi:hypothetical protein
MNERRVPPLLNVGWEIGDLGRRSPHYDADYLNGRVRKWVNHDYSGVEVYDYDADLVLSQIFKIIENLTKDIAIPNKFISIKEFLP